MDRRFRRLSVIETVLGAMGLTYCFEALMGKEDVERHKPDPDIYLRTAARLGVPPAMCVVIEDSDLGIGAAKRAAMRCVGVANTLPAERLAEADLVVPSLMDQERILGFIRGEQANCGAIDGAVSH